MMGVTTAAHRRRLGRGSLPRGPLEHRGGWWTLGEGCEGRDDEFWGRDDAHFGSGNGWLRALVVDAEVNSSNDDEKVWHIGPDP